MCWDGKETYRKLKDDARAEVLFCFRFRCSRSRSRCRRRRISGFYLRYLRGRSSPPPNAQLPLQKVLLSLQYISNCIGKSSRHDEVNAHTVIFLKIVSQNAPDCISAVQSFQKNFRGGMPPDPPGKLVVFGHSGLLPQTINPR